MRVCMSACVHMSSCVCDCMLCVLVHLLVPAWGLVFSYWTWSSGFELHWLASKLLGPVWLQPPCVVKASPELCLPIFTWSYLYWILLSLPPTFWHCRCVPAWLMSCSFNQLPPYLKALGHLNERILPFPIAICRQPTPRYAAGYALPAPTSVPTAKSNVFIGISFIYFPIRSTCPWCSHG